MDAPGRARADVSVRVRLPPGAPVEVERVAIARVVVSRLARHHVSAHPALQRVRDASVHLVLLKAQQLEIVAVTHPVAAHGSLAMNCAHSR